jgi:VanZ family protein
MVLCYLGRIATLPRILIIYGFTFASFCEFLHIFIPYRTASIFDLLANYLGVTIGFLVFKLAQRFRLIPILDA